MRIGAFELDCAFKGHFVLAEVRAGRARLFQSLWIRNVRGTPEDWLKLFAVVDGKRTKRKAVRGLAVNDEARSLALEQDIQAALTVPKELGPGSYSARLVIDYSQGERELTFDFEISDERVIPTDFARAPMLAAHIREDDALRAIAAVALDDASSDAPEAALEGLYGALLDRQLGYQPPVAARFPDCQRISPPSYAASIGGSCADLSLLLASLLWCRGLSPAILLFPQHMAAGCFTGDAPDFETLSDNRDIARLMDTGALAAVEVTRLCRGQAAEYAAAAAQIRDRVAPGGEPCVLVNIKRVLRNETARLLQDGVEELPCSCPNCGYDRFPAPWGAGESCPACGAPLPAPEQTAAPEELPEDPEIVSGAILYAAQAGGAVVQRLLQPDADQVRVAPMWRGATVRRIADRAMERGRMSRLILPEGLTEIGDYAFYRCDRLPAVSLPGDLRALGSGAFCGSGLKKVRVPAGVKRIARMCFSGCESLAGVEFAEGVEYIEERAFADCPKLRQVRIPASVVHIARRAFDPGCELIVLSQKTIVEN